MNTNEAIKKILLLLIIVFSVSCCGYVKHKVQINSGASFSNTNESVFFIFRSDFIEIENDLVPMSQSSGTGTSVFSSKVYSDILTAGHVCVDYILDMPDVQHQYQIMDFWGNERKADLIAIDAESDLCLLRIYASSRPAKISETNSQSGHRVHYSGYPMGIYMPGTLHHFSGYYSGTDNVGFSMFSLAVTGGSSGSAVMNGNGEIVGVISSVTEDFANLVIGPGIERIKTFIFLSANCEKYCVEM